MKTTLSLVLFFVSSFALATPALVPKVHGGKTYEVTVSKDVVYGKALSHQDWNSEESHEMDLFLDIYSPVVEEEQVDLAKRPVIFLFHGGSFKRGCKEREEIVKSGYYFAERGFIALAANYRVAKDKGTLPKVLYDIWASRSLPEVIAEERDAYIAMYPAARDAKAAVRWLYANADSLNADTDHIAALGNSAGALLALTLGITEPEDFVNEVSTEDDPTLQTTHLDYPVKIHTVIDHWGGPFLVEMQWLYWDNYRYDSSDAPVQIVHGTFDTKVPFTEPLRLIANFKFHDIPYELHTLHGVGHDVGDRLIDGKSIDRLALDFIVKQQGLRLSGNPI